MIKVSFGLNLECTGKPSLLCRCNLFLRESSDGVLSVNPLQRRRSRKSLSPFFNFFRGVSPGLRDSRRPRAGTRTSHLPCRHHYSTRSFTIVKVNSRPLRSPRTPPQNVQRQTTLRGLVSTRIVLHTPEVLRKDHILLSTSLLKWHLWSQGTTPPLTHHTWIYVLYSYCVWPKICLLDS